MWKGAGKVLNYPYICDYEFIVWGQKYHIRYFGGSQKSNRTDRTENKFILSKTNFKFSAHSDKHRRALRHTLISIKSDIISD